MLNHSELVAFAREQGNVAASGEDTLFAVASQVMYYGVTGDTERDTFIPVYKAYAEAKNTSGYGRKIDVTNEKSIGASASKLARFAKIGKLGYFDLPERVVDLAPDGSKYEQMARVFVAQLKAPDKKLTRDEILAALAPADPKQKTIGVFLEAEMKRFEKFEADTLEGIDAVRFSGLRAAIAELAASFQRDPSQYDVVEAEHDDSPVSDTPPVPEVPEDLTNGAIENLADILSGKFKVQTTDATRLHLNTVQ